MKAFGILVSLFVLGLAVAAAQPRPTTGFAAGTIAITRQGAMSFTFVSSTDDDVKTFTGQIKQLEGKYVLEDSTNNTMYKLDDQDKAKSYDGQKVKVTGTLDANTNTIHISSIEAA